MSFVRYCIPALLLLPACNLATPNSFQTDNVAFGTGGSVHAQVLQKYCAACHAPGTSEAAEKWVGWTDQQFIDSGLIIAGDPGSSDLYQFMLGNGDQMPPAGNPVPSADQIQSIADWISGLNNNSI